MTQIGSIPPVRAGFNTISPFKGAIAAPSLPTGLEKVHTEPAPAKPDGLGHLIRTLSVRFEANRWANKAEAHYPVVVVGGGMAGLMALHELVNKHQVPAVLLESDRRLGGNSQSDVAQNGVPHPTGATIFIPGGPEYAKLWQELNIPLDPNQLLKPEIFVMNNERFTAFKINPTDPDDLAPRHKTNLKAAKGFQKLLDDLKAIAQQPRLAPVIPIQQATLWALKKWDSIPLSKFLKPYGKLVQKLAEPYIQSDLAAASKKVGAYVGMIDLEDLNNPRYVLPGGNGYIIQQLNQKILKGAGIKDPQNPDTPIRLTHMVEKVHQEKGDNKVYLRYRDADGQKHVISADHVLMASPYQHLPKLMALPEESVKLMKAIPKSSYAIVNIFLKTTPLRTHQFYMLPDSGRIADLVVTPREPGPNREPNPMEPSVMSIYVPHVGKKRNTEKLGQEILAEIKENFPEITDDIVEGVRVNPFKFSMAAPAPGQVEALKNLPRTYGKVTLINSDGGAIPSLLTAITEAQLGVQTALAALNDRDPSRQTPRKVS